MFCDVEGERKTEQLSGCQKSRETLARAVRVVCILRLGFDFTKLYSAYWLLLVVSGGSATFGDLWWTFAGN